MNTTGTGAMLCMSCGRPMLTSVTIGGMQYHEECTRGPGWQRPTYGPNPTPTYPGAFVLPAMTEDRVREIIRQELEKFELVDRKDPR